MLCRAANTASMVPSAPVMSLKKHEICYRCITGLYKLIENKFHLGTFFSIYDTVKIDLSTKKNIKNTILVNTRLY